MAEEFVDALKREEAKLARELAMSPVFQRLQAVRLTLSTYGVETAQGPDVPAHQSGGSHPGSALSRVIVDTFRRIDASGADGPRYGREGSQSAEVIREAEAYLDQVGRRAQSAEILQHLEERGIKIKGANPVAVVASYLSTSKLFNNLRGKGYGLSRWPQPDEAASSDLAFTDEEFDLEAGFDPKTEAAIPVKEIAAD